MSVFFIVLAFLAGCLFTRWRMRARVAYLIRQHWAEVQQQLDRERAEMARWRCYD